MNARRMVLLCSVFLAGCGFSAIAPSGKSRATPAPDRDYLLELTIEDATNKSQRTVRKAFKEFRAAPEWQSLGLKINAKNISSDSGDFEITFQDGTRVLLTIGTSDDRVLVSDDGKVRVEARVLMLFTDEELDEINSLVEQAP